MHSVVSFGDSETNVAMGKFRASSIEATVPTDQETFVAETMDSLDRSRQLEVEDKAYPKTTPP